MSYKIREYKTTAYGKYYNGTFEYNNKVFNCEVRFDGPTYHQGGFDKCLKIINGHEYFNDDKFRIDVIQELPDNKLYITLPYGFSKKDVWNNIIKELVINLTV